MPATYHPCLPGKWTPSALEQPDDAYLRVSGPLGPDRPVLHHGVPVSRALTGKSLTQLFRQPISKSFVLILRHGIDLAVYRIRCVLFEFDHVIPWLGRWKSLRFFFTEHFCKLLILRWYFYLLGVLLRCDGEISGRGFDATLCFKLLDNCCFDSFGNSFSNYRSCSGNASMLRLRKN